MFSKEVIIRCSDRDIEELVRRHYPQYKEYELYASEEHDNSYMVVTISSTDVGTYERDAFEAGDGQYMARTLLDKMCFDGYLEPGKYIIDGTW